MSNEIKKPVPGGRSVVRARAYCDAWRKYGDVVTEFTGWHIHSFGREIKFVSQDFAHTQTMGIPFIEALVAAIKKAEKCQTKPRSSAPSSSVESPTPLKPPVLRRRSFVRSMETCDLKEPSSVLENSECPSPTSSSSESSPSPSSQTSPSSSK